MTSPAAPDPPRATALRPWRGVAIGVGGLAVALAALAAAFLGHVPAPPSGLAAARPDAAPRPSAAPDGRSDAPPPWAIPSAPAAAAASPTEAPGPSTERPRVARQAARPTAPAAYPPAIEDAIHAALEGGRAQPWSALGVRGWVTVSPLGGPSGSCRAYRVVRDTGASAPQTLCRTPDGRWRGG